MYTRLALAVLTSTSTEKKQEMKDNTIQHSVQRSFNVEKVNDSPHRAGGGTAAFADQCSPSSP